VSQKTPRMTPALFHIMLALAERPMHGYALLKRIDERSQGRVEIGPSSLYYALGRLDDAGLIGDAEPDACDRDEDPHEEQRRYYGITQQGRDFLEAELGVLHGIVDHARAIGVAAE